MNCATCPRDTSSFCLVPNQDRTGDQLVCCDCAIEQGVYCTIHERPHSYYPPLGTACVFCIHQAIQRNARMADGIYQRIIVGLPHQEVNRIIGWSDDLDWWDKVTLVFESIVRLTVIRKSSIDEVIQEVITSQSANLVVPDGY